MDLSKLGNMGDLGGMMKKVQKMQDDVKEAQKKLAEKEVTGESGGGMIKITATCKHDATKVEIDPTVVPGLADDAKEMLEDLVAAAINDTNQKIERCTKDTMGGVTGGLDLPPGLF